jgi:hypothetical protein
LVQCDNLFLYSVLSELLEMHYMNAGKGREGRTATKQNTQRHASSKRERGRKEGHKNKNNNNNKKEDDIPEQVGPKLEIGDKKDDAMKACFAAVAAAIVECDSEEFWIAHLLHTSGSITMFFRPRAPFAGARVPNSLRLFLTIPQVILSTGV